MEGRMRDSEEANALQPVSLDLRKTVPWIIFVLFFAVLNETVFVVSTPSIAAELALKPSEVSLVLTSFMIIFGTGSIVYGKLSDMYSLKKMVMIGLLIYGGGSLLGFLAHRYYPAVIAARILQGIGGSAIPTLLMIMITRYFKSRDRGKMFGIVGSTVALSEGMGPVIGGFISERLHWSFLFIIPLFTLLSIPFFLKTLPEEQPRGGKADFIGAVLFVAATALLILYLTDSRWPYLVISLILYGGFAVHIRRVEEPFIELSMLTNGRWVRGLLSAIALFGTMAGLLFMVPQMLSQVHLMTAGAIGWVMFPGAISLVFFGVYGGTLVDRKGYSRVYYIGLALYISSLLLLSILAGAAPWLLSAVLVAAYVGFSFLKTSLATGVSQTLTEQEAGVGMGMLNLVSFLSEAAGMALVGKMLADGVLEIPLIPTITASSAYSYSNLFFSFAIIIALGAVLYFSAFRRSR